MRHLEFKPDGRLWIWRYVGNTTVTKWSKPFALEICLRAARRNYGWGTLPELYYT